LDQISSARTFMIEEQRRRPLPRQDGASDLCRCLFSRSGTLHFSDCEFDLRRALTSGLVDPYDHVCVVEMLVDVPRIAISIGPIIVSWPVILLQPADPVILVAGEAALR